MSFFSLLSKLSPHRSIIGSFTGGSSFARAVAKGPGQRFPLEMRLSPAPPETTQPEPQEGLEAKAFAQDEVDAFLHFGQWLATPNSSNVAEIHYDGDTSQLEIRFKNGGYYAYDDVSIREAESFARAASAGKWVWSNLRVRGTIFGFRKPYRFLSGPSTYEPQWMKKSALRTLHGKIGPEGERNKAVLKRLMPKRWGVR